MAKHPQNRSQPRSNPENEPDVDLVKKIQSGRHDLYHELVARYQDKLYNFGLRMCRNTSDAEDLVQDTLLNVFKYLKGFRYEAKFKNWLYKIAASVCIKKRRRTKYMPERTLSLEDFLPKDKADISDTVPVWASNPINQVLNSELSNQLNAAIHSLPRKYRIVSVLRDVEGFSTVETAQILGITPSNVKVRLHRARLYLREKLKTYYEQYTPK